MKGSLKLQALEVVAVCLAAAAMSACSRTQSAEAVSPASWDPKAAAVYLDQREVTWAGWQGAARDHGTFCVSCHTAVPYALARPKLRKLIGESGLSPSERTLLDDVTKRVQLWNEIGPFYSDEGYGGDKVARSRGTESVLNALILASYDGQNGHLTDTTRAALGNMWALQQRDGDGKGAWSWIQFGMEPFEAKDSQYYGAALAAIAVGTAPDNYGSSPEITQNLTMLRDYLNRNYASQSTINQVMLLWASTKLPGLIDAERQKSLVNEVWDKQRPDGSWDLSSLTWPKDWSLHSFVRERWRSDGTRQIRRSDGYATGLIVFSLQQAGVSATDPRLARGISWLARNQNKAEGDWLSDSVNQRRAPSSNVGHFMDDAATGFAVLALSGSSVTAYNDGVTSHRSLSASRRDPEKK